MLAHELIEGPLHAGKLNVPGIPVCQQVYFKKSIFMRFENETMASQLLIGAPLVKLQRNVRRHTFISKVHNETIALSFSS